MFDYHAWLVLSESTTESDAGGLQGKLEQLRVLTKGLITSRPTEPIIGVNHEWVFQCSVGHNHRGDAYVRLEDLLNWIVRELPGTHGLVYLRDDEAPDFSNEYRVLVVSRGRIEQRSDPFLSPIVPLVED